MSHHNMFSSQSKFDKNQTQMKGLKKDYKEKVINKEKLFEILITKYHFGSFMAHKLIDNWDDQIKSKFKIPNRRSWIPKGIL